MKETFNITNIPCNTCGFTMGNHLTLINGIFGIEIDIFCKTITIDYTDEISREEILQKLEEFGYL